MFRFFSKVSHSRTQSSACSHNHINTYVKKIRTFFGKSWGMMSYLSNAPLTFTTCQVLTERQQKLWKNNNNKKSAQTNFLLTRFQLHELGSHKIIPWLYRLVVYSMHVHPVPFNFSFVCSFVLFLPSLLTRKTQSRDNILRNFYSTMRSTY